MTKEELALLQKRLPDEYKYFFEYVQGHSDYEEYINNGKIDFPKIVTAHKYAVQYAEYNDYFYKNNPGAPNFYSPIIPNDFPAYYRYLEFKNRT